MLHDARTSTSRGPNKQLYPQCFGTLRLHVYGPYLLGCAAIAEHIPVAISMGSGDRFHSTVQKHHSLRNAVFRKAFTCSGADAKCAVLEIPD